MRQVLFVVPGLGVRVFGFGIMLVLAVFGAVRLTAWRARREKLDPESVYDLAFGLLLGGILGARAFYVIQHPEVIARPWDILKFWQGGIVFYGCIAGGLVGTLLSWSRRPFPFLPMADAVAPSLALGLGLGRIGCFLNGCCFGDRCTLPWALRFPARTLPWAEHVRRGWLPPAASQSLPVHPTQLYAALDGLILLALLSAFYPYRKRDGEVMALLMVTYPVTRFLIEALRDDEGVFLAGMTFSQGVSVLVFIAGLAFWAWLSSRPRGRFADASAIRRARLRPSRATLLAR